jgi:hypothetical protein
MISTATPVAKITLVDNNSAGMRLEKYFQDSIKMNAQDIKSKETNARKTPINVRRWNRCLRNND